MSTEEQHAIIGRAVQEYGETKKQLEAYLAKANQIGDTLYDIGRNLHFPDWSIQSWQPFDGGAREFICQGFSKDGKEQSGTGNNPARAICLAIVEASMK
jgi:hypothetical protein